MSRAMVKPDDLPAVNGSVQNAGGMTCLSENVIIPPNVCSEGRSHDNAPHDKQKVLLPLRFAQSDAQSDTARLRNTESTPNFSRVLPKRPWLHRRAHTSHAIMSIPGAPIGAACTYETSGVKKWDPTTRDSSAWDSLRRDEELWSANGDCSVHLYSPGKSRRRPSFRVSSSLLVTTGCAQMLKECSGPTGVAQRPDSFISSISSGSASCHSDQDNYDLYLPAPEEALRSEAFRWHIATRNFFAWLQDAPLVGMNLGDALVDLLDRMNHFRPNGNNTSDLLSYAGRIGYLNFIGCPEYALAMLRLAEQFKLEDLWIESFAHCVGMNDHLPNSAAYEATSRVTKALIARAYLEMDLHLSRVSRALKSFLEEELSSANSGLPAGAQTHLERFRLFLLTHYIEEFGYWPPEEGAVLGKPLLRMMTAEFTNLYDFLVDTRSSNSIQDQSKPTDGGICVLQHLDAFNKRHRYEPLQYPLPLVPEYDGPVGRVASQRGFRAFKLGKAQSEANLRTNKDAAIMKATNSDRPELLQSSLVKDYIRFEREWSSKPEEKISLPDARKVRWIVIYSMLQMLKSVTRAPEQVTNPDAVPYHLCVLTAGTPNWNPRTAAIETEALARTKSIIAAGRQSDQSLLSFIADSGAISLVIEPDRDDEEYVVPQQQSSNEQQSLRPAPLRINTGDLAKPTSSTMSRRPKSSSWTSPTKKTLVSPASRLSLNDELSEYDDSQGLSSTAIQASRETSHSATDTAILPPQVFRPVSPLPSTDRSTPVPEPNSEALIFHNHTVSSSLDSDSDDSYISPHSYRSSNSSAATTSSPRSSHSWRSHSDDSGDGSLSEISSCEDDLLQTPKSTQFHFVKNVYSMDPPSSSSPAADARKSFSGLDFWSRRTSGKQQLNQELSLLQATDEGDSDDDDEVHAPFESCVDFYQAVQLLPHIIPEQEGEEV